MWEVSQINTLAAWALWQSRVLDSEVLHSGSGLISAWGTKIPRVVCYGMKGDYNKRQNKKQKEKIQTNGKCRIRQTKADKKGTFTDTHIKLKQPKEKEARK